MCFDANGSVTASPDLRQPSDDLFITFGKRLHPYPGAAAASKGYRTVIEQLHVGASRTPPCKIVTRNGEVVGSISFNGRVWLGAGDFPHDVCVYDPSSHGATR